MKTIVSLVAVIFLFILASCENQSGNLIGSFKVTKKISQKEKTFGLNQSTDWGDIYLSSHGDTLKSFVASSEIYLNTKVGDIVLVSKDKFGAITINNQVKRFQIGYCKIIEKIETFGTYELMVVSRGGDVIKVNRVPEIVYFNTSVSDSVFIKKNRGLGIYYTE